MFACGISLAVVVSPGRQRAGTRRVSRDTRLSRRVIISADDVSLSLHLIRRFCVCIGRPWCCGCIHSCIVCRLSQYCTSFVVGIAVYAHCRRASLLHFVLHINGVYVSSFYLKFHVPVVVSARKSPSVGVCWRTADEVRRRSHDNYYVRASIDTRASI